MTELGHDPRGEIPSSRTTSSAVAAAILLGADRRKNKKRRDPPFAAMGYETPHVISRSYLELFAN